MQTFQLFCGRNIPSGGTVSDNEVADFLRFVVTPRFDGFTVQECTGFWKGEMEETLLISICCERFDAPKVAEIANLWKTQFQQDSVAIQQLPALQFV